MKGITMRGHTAPTTHRTSGLEFSFMSSNRNVEDKQQARCFPSLLGLHDKSR
jgi:hypothetical protein